MGDVMRRAKEAEGAVRVGAWAAMLAVPSWSPAVMAQSAGDADEATSVIQEIIVTAQKRASTVHDTPIAITALSAEILADLNIRGAADLESYLPSVTFQDYDVTIRGVGRSIRKLSSDPGVANYYNGIYSEEFGVASSEAALYDVERIEVLRGPQGTLYGRNAIGGAINYITFKPQFESGADARVILGADGLAQFFGLVNLPVVDDRLAVRLVGAQLGRDGIQSPRAVAGQAPLGETGDEDDRSLALSLRFAPTGQWDINLRLSDRLRDRRPSSAVYLGDGPLNSRTRREDAACFPAGTLCYIQRSSSFLLNPNASSTLGVNGDGFGDDVSFAVTPDVLDHQRYDQQAASLDILWRSPEGRISARYVGGYTQYDSALLSDQGFSGRNTDAFLSDPTASGAGFFGRTPTGEQLSRRFYDQLLVGEASSHELQFNVDLSAFDLVAGLYKYDITSTQDLRLKEQGQFGAFVVDPTYGLLGDNPLGPACRSGPVACALGSWSGSADGTYFRNINRSETDALAAYAQADMRLSSQFLFTLGARWSRDQKNGTESLFSYFELDPSLLGMDLATANALLTTNAITFLPNGEPLRLQGIPGTVNLVGPAHDDSWSSVNWRAVLNWTPAPETMVYGSVSTGYRSGGFNLGALTPETYDKEEITAYEIGLKQDFMERALRANFAAYFYQYENQQLNINSILPDPLLGPRLFNLAINVPESEAYGLEAELTWTAGALTLSALYSYMHSEISTDFFAVDSTDPAQPLAMQNLRGNALANSPENKFALWGSYRWGLGKHGALTLFSTVSYTDEQKATLFNSPIDVIPGYARWDLRLAWDFNDGRTSIAAFLNNVTDEAYLLNQPGGVDTVKFSRVGTISDPRSFGIELRRRFGG
jgi:iron complex outermembrane recepter protein